MKRKASYLILAAFLITGVPSGYALTPGAVPGVAPEVAPEDSGIVSLDFKDADIKTVLRVMSLKSGVNIVAGPEVLGTVTIRLEDVPWEKALQVVLRTYNYVYERDGNIIRVTTRDRMEQEPVITQTFILNYIPAAEVEDAIKRMLTERGDIRTSKRTNIVIVTDIPTNVYQIGVIIKRLDQQTPQAYIDSKIIETSVSEAEDIGIQWNTGGANNNLGALTGSSRPTTFPFFTSTTKNDEELGHFIRQFLPINIAGSTTGLSSDNRAFPTNPVQATAGQAFSFGTLNFSSMSAIMQFLETKSNTKIRSNPRITVLNHQEATVQVGTEVPIPNFERNETTGSLEITDIDYRKVGVVLTVTPHINSAEEILVDLKPEVSSEAALLNFGDFSAPRFNITEAKTQVLIKSGQTIAIGGLRTDKAQYAEAKIPFFGDLPLVGKLFRSKRQDETSNEQKETLFFITVTMVDTEGQPTGAMAEKIYAKAKTASNQSSATAGDNSWDQLEEDDGSPVGMKQDDLTMGSSAVT
ncbi:MAG: secretin and TonB N-terminal domain-containing protein [Candidatus Omnitrophota bacterium]|nr:secretin and TonB N-terminal domain-containing protein [Candidatus Omnitrophota bacterium]